MYYTPRKFECEKCGCKINYSQSESYSFLPVSSNGNPFCPKCLIVFISKNVPEMTAAVEIVKKEFAPFKF